MKKTALCLILALLLTGCAEPKVHVLSSDEQIAVLAERFSGLESEVEWLSYESSTQFAVTDLDGNGLLELVVSSMQGTGLFSYSHYYEVNEDGSGVTEWQWPQPMESEPDIGYADMAFYSDEDGVRHYRLEDYIRNGYAENWLGLYDVVYRDDMIEQTLLAERYAVIRDGSDEFDMTFYDGNGQEITEAEFDAVANTMQTGQTAHIGWMGYDQVKGLGQEDLVRPLADSWAEFSAESV